MPWESQGFAPARVVLFVSVSCHMVKCFDVVSSFSGFDMHIWVAAVFIHVLPCAAMAVGLHDLAWHARPPRPHISSIYDVYVDISVVTCVF